MNANTNENQKCKDERRIGRSEFKVKLGWALAVSQRVPSRLCGPMGDL